MIDQFRLPLDLFYNIFESSNKIFLIYFRLFCDLHLIYSLTLSIALDFYIWLVYCCNIAVVFFFLIFFSMDHLKHQHNVLHRIDWEFSDFYQNLINFEFLRAQCCCNCRFLLCICTQASRVNICSTTLNTLMEQFNNIREELDLIDVVMFAGVESVQ